MSAVATKQSVSNAILSAGFQPRYSGKDKVMYISGNEAAVKKYITVRNFLGKANNAYLKFKQG